MQCSTSWLNEYVKLTLPAEELAHRLSMAGVETVAAPRFKDKPQGVVVARIIGVEPHPNADRLTVCTVETGSGQAAVVCGAPNARPGILTPMALPGAVLKGGFKIKKSKLRGVESAGMLCAEDELGLSEDHTGIMELDADLAPGTDFGQIVDWNDWLLEVDLTPNRVDCASVFGLAREVAALTGQKAVLKPLDYTTSGTPTAELAQVEVLDPDLCPRYTAALLTGLATAPSPWWVRDRLLSGGVRPINNLVDVTNYILLELNQPLHAFDFRNVAGGKIIVRRAGSDKKFTTLDNQVRDLDPDMLMICDAERPVGLAGVMGGLNSEVEDDTSQVLIESAYFNPTSTRRTSTKLGLSTEASYRFERGIDPNNALKALERSAAMMNALGGGEIHPGWIDVYPEYQSMPDLPLRVQKTNDFIGIDIPAREMIRLLDSIEVEASEVEPGRLEVKIPSWRPDLEREIDLVEEIARLYGYDEIPITFPEMTEPAAPTPPLEALRMRISPQLADEGLHQVVCYSFIQSNAAQLMGWPEDDPRHSPVRMLNPISEDQAVMRTSLLPGLISTLAYNLRQGNDPVRLFEWGVVFFPKGDNVQPLENCRVGGLLQGRRNPAGWTSGPQKVDFWDVKGIIERLVARLMLSGISYEPLSAAEYKPGRAARVVKDGRELGRFGQLSNKALAAFEVKVEAFAFDLDAEALLRLTQEPLPAFEPLPRFPSITRDVALVVKKSITAGMILNQVAEIKDPLLVDAAIFDIYEGQPLADDEKSIGIRVRYRSGDKTLTEEEITPLHDRLTRHLIKNTGGKLRA